MATHAELTFTPDSFRDLVNQWPPFVAQGVSVTEVAEDWTRVTVRMELTPANANFFGTAFGGTLFAMLDPFLAILTDRQLGKGYAVWDRSARIEFLRPGRSAVTATVEVPASVVEEIRAATADGDKHLRWFEIPLLDEDGEVVAVQRRELYVRRHREQPQA